MQAVRRGGRDRGVRDRGRGAFDLAAVGTGTGTPGRCGPASAPGAWSGVIRCHICLTNPDICRSWFRWSGRGGRCAWWRRTAARPCRRNAPRAGSSPSAGWTRTGAPRAGRASACPTVRAIAAAHRGTMSLRPRAGGGLEVTVGRPGGRQGSPVAGGESLRGRGGDRPATPAASGRGARRPPRSAPPRADAPPPESTWPSWRASPSPTPACSRRTRSTTSAPSTWGPCAWCWWAPRPRGPTTSCSCRPAPWPTPAAAGAA